MPVPDPSAEPALSAAPLTLPTDTISISPEGAAAASIVADSGSAAGGFSAAPSASATPYAANSLTAEAGLVDGADSGVADGLESDFVSISPEGATASAALSAGSDSSLSASAGSDSSTETAIPTHDLQTENTASVADFVSKKEEHQYDKVVEKTNHMLRISDAADHIDPDGTMVGGNYEFPVSHNDGSDAEFQHDLNLALGEKNGSTGAHGGLIPPTHREGFINSLHHDHDALHVDHFNGSIFPVGTLLHALVDVVGGHLEE